jgi:DNA-binding CsgD family transcriptional regulator
MEYIFQAFLDELELAGNIHQLRDVLAAVAVGIGLGSYAYLALANSPSKRPSLISSYDIRWTDHYLAKRYEQRDPVIVRSLRDPKSFEWGPDTVWSGTSIWVRNFFHEAASFGIHAGLTIPMGRWQGGRAALTFATDCRSEILSLIRHYAGELRMIAYSFHKQVRNLFHPSYIIEGVSLSLRQVQCLEWLARGKTIEETAMLLKVKPSTVKYHLEVVREKLGVHTSVQAALALAEMRRNLRGQ